VVFATVSIYGQVFHRNKVDDLEVDANGSCSGPLTDFHVFNASRRTSDRSHANALTVLPQWMLGLFLGKHRGQIVARDADRGWVSEAGRVVV
jgi:hypothetical protein